MGAEAFVQLHVCDVDKVSAEQAFDQALEHAHYEHGHAGYSGTLAEKTSFVVIPLPDGANACELAYQLTDNDDLRIFNKWGPAGCLRAPGVGYYFFGWASC